MISDFSRMDRVQMKDLKSIGHSYLPELDKWGMNDLGADYIYTGSNPLDFMLPNGLKEVMDYEVWEKCSDQSNKIPYISDLERVKKIHSKLNFIVIDANHYNQIIFGFLEKTINTVLIVHSTDIRSTISIRRFVVELIKRKIQIPIVLK